MVVFSQFSILVCVHYYSYGGYSSGGYGSSGADQTSQYGQSAGGYGQQQQQVIGNSYLFVFH